MNVVSDEQTIVNIQGIRYVSWSKNSYSATTNGRFIVTVTYKGNHQSFYYRDEASARNLFNKIREAMDKNAPKVS